MQLVQDITAYQKLGVDQVIGQLNHFNDSVEVVTYQNQSSELSGPCASIFI